MKEIMSVRREVVEVEREHGLFGYLLLDTLTTNNVRQFNSSH